jgi:hypothetical protein
MAMMMMLNDATYYSVALKVILDFRNNY